MINFGGCTQEPFKILEDLYTQALLSQKNIEAMAISSIDIDKMVPHSRFVNVKYIQDDKIIFFSNYESNKARQFALCNKVSCLFYWPTIDSQIRIQGIISKTSKNFSDLHFRSRTPEKNAAAISSMQSSFIDSYDLVKQNYKSAIKQKVLTNRPEYWGGYSINPDYFEFWSGNADRLNKREEYKLVNNIWRYAVLQP